MPRTLIALLCLLSLWGPEVRAQARVFDPDVHYQWTGLNSDPLKNPNNEGVIRRVIAQFTILPLDVVEELANKVIAGGGREAKVCKGNTLPGMSFGEGRVWNGTVHVAWRNSSEECSPAQVWDAERPAQGDAVTHYTVYRVRACKNLAPGWPTKTPPPTPQKAKPPGPDYSGIPSVVCVVGQRFPNPCC